jgi:hypothetical protein
VAILRQLFDAALAGRSQKRFFLLSGHETALVAQLSMLLLPFLRAAAVSSFSSQARSVTVKRKTIGAGVSDRTLRCWQSLVCETMIDSIPFPSGYDSRSLSLKI